MWLYPLPSLVALAGWSYIYVTSGWTFALGGLALLASGVRGVQADAGGQGPGATVAANRSRGSRLPGLDTEPRP